TNRAHGRTPHGGRARSRRSRRRHAPRTTTRLRHSRRRHGRPGRSERLPRGDGVTSTTDSAILTVSGLNARIAGQQVVEDVSFSVASTGVTALLGRNGVGKTSTIKGILGLIERKGEVTFA